jgi:hypothetical protein
MIALVFFGPPDGATLRSFGPHRAAVTPVTTLVMQRS